MRLWKFLVLFLTIFQSNWARAQDDEGDNPFLIKIPFDDFDQNDTSTAKPLDEVLSAVAARLNCTTLELNHRGEKTEEVLRDTIFQPTTTTTTTTERPTAFKTPETHGAEDEYEYEDEDGATPNPENESTEKPNKDGKIKKTKRSTDDANPSKNVTIHHNYSIVKTYPTVQNISETKEANITMCTAPFYDNGDEYFWYQIIVENGGRPGEVSNATRLTPNVTQVLNPCERPITKTVPPLEDLLYKYELIEFEKVYRREEAYLRFAGTPSEFVDVHGHFVWSPPGYRRRYYRLEYRKDDTGFYLQVHRGQKCEFFKNPVSIKCSKSNQICYCLEDGTEECSYLRSLPAGLAASLVGG